MLPIRYLYANLRLSLTTMAIVTLLERHDKGLEALGEDLIRIIQDKDLEPIYQTSALIDYLTMQEFELDYDFDRSQIEEELNWLVEEIHYLQEKYRREFRMKPRSIHLELPNTIIFELPVQSPRIIVHRRR